MASHLIPKEKNQRADVVKRHYVNLHKILSNFPEVLFSVTMKCFQDSLIDMNTKTAITSSNGQNGSSILLDHIHSKLEQSDDYLPLVLSIFKEEVSLKDIVSKMELFVANAREPEKTVPTVKLLPKDNACSDTAIVVTYAEKLKESFDALLFMLVIIVSQANINLLGLKLKINLFLQYARETTPEVQLILDDMEDRCHSPEGVILFLVNRNLLGYLNFELLNVFKQFLTENYEIRDKIAEYKSKHKVFICENLKNIVKVFKENPRLAPASVVGLPMIKVYLTEPWQGKSYYQWKEIMENIVDWPDHLLIKSIDINCVIIIYHVLPFILSRVVNDLTNKNIIRRFSAVGATFTISSEVLELARTDSEWISSVIEQATSLEKMKLSSGTSEDVELEKEHPLEPKSDIYQPAQSQPLDQSSPAPIPLEGGYDDEIFLSPSPKDLICPICQLTLREPHQLSCCGSTLCQVCTIKTSAKLKCPCCRNTNHSMMLDKKTRGRIMSLKIKCTMPDCYWYGELLDLNMHWNRNCPQPIQYQLSLVPKFAYPVLSTLQYKIIPVYRTIEQFRINNEYEAELYTDPFYTTQGGYKMTLNVYPNGDGPGKGTHISAFICLMKGENDHNLPFPFSGIFTIKLLNWKQDTGHVVKSVVFDETMPLKYRRQVTTGQMANGWGCDFLSHTKLMGESSDHQYLYENKLCFQILFAPINQTGPPVPSWYDEMSGESATPPCTRTLYSYSTYKTTNRYWTSLTFYSGDKGYKLELVVWPHSGSVGFYLNKGEHDDRLKWPLTADITIQLLNWREDINHLEWTFHHDPSQLEGCKRVTQGYRAPTRLRYRRQLITDSVLEISSKAEYIKNDNLCFKIVSVNVL